MKNWLTYLDEAEAHVRGGRIHEVRGLLKRGPTSKVPRIHARRLANILRRCDLVNRGLALLKPIIYPEKQNIVKAHPAEIAEYAILLTRTGSIPEAQSLLNQLDARALPEVELHRAFAHFATWDYAASLPYLNVYIQTAPTEYQRTVGLVNLAAAYIATAALSEANQILLECLDRTSREGLDRLRANSFELYAQVHIERGDYAQALASLDQAANILRDEKFSEALYVRKWRAIALALRDHDMSPLADFFKLALAVGDWENLRDAQFYALKLQFSEPLFYRLMFGTANPFFRQKLSRAFPLVPVPESFVFGDEHTSPTLDINTGEILRTQIGLSGNTHQILFTLHKDFYRPSRIATLFSDLYPGEHYDVFSSPDRVHQALRRCRARLKELELPIAIIKNLNGYRIESRMPVRVPLQRLSIDPLEQKIARLRQSHFDQALTARQIQNTLGMTVTEYRWFVGRALNRGLITSLGAHAATRYKVA